MHRGEEAGDVCRTSRGWINSGMCLMNFRKSSNNNFLLEEEKKSEKKTNSRTAPQIWSIIIKNPTNESAIVSVGRIPTLGHDRDFVLCPGQHMFPVNTG